MLDPSIEAISYEIDMFVWGLEQSAKQLDDRRRRNLMIEGVALHARNLMGLFGKGNKWPNDIRAITYCPQFAAPAGFDCMWNRVNEQIAHLTTQRITDAQQVATEKDKMWRPEQFRELIHGTKEFVQQMLKASHPLSPDLSRRLDCLISKLNEAPAIGATGMAGPPYGT